MKWFRDYNSAALSAVLRSEPIEKLDLTSPIKHIIGSNYASFISQTVEQDKKDLFFIIYTSWCAFTPKLRQSIQKLQQDDSFKSLQSRIVFAEIDSSLNDVSGVEVVETPLVFFYPAGKVLDEPTKLSVSINDFIDEYYFASNKADATITMTAHHDEL